MAWWPFGNRKRDQGADGGAGTSGDGTFISSGGDGASGDTDAPHEGSGGGWWSDLFSGTGGDNDGGSSDGGGDGGGGDGGGGGGD